MGNRFATSPRVVSCLFRERSTEERRFGWHITFSFQNKKEHQARNITLDCLIQSRTAASVLWPAALLSLHLPALLPRLHLLVNARAAGAVPAARVRWTRSGVVARVRPAAPRLAGPLVRPAPRPSLATGVPRPC